MLYSMRLRQKLVNAYAFINFEAQKTFSESTLKYILMKRAVFYGTRLISAQKETEFSGSNYSEVKKVYTILDMHGISHGQEHHQSLSHD